MKRYILPVSFLMIFVIPNLLFSLLKTPEGPKEIIIETTAPETGSEQIILIDDNDEIIKMELDDYVLCVLLGEVPASFEIEALKAQAVATRTYTIRHYLDYNKHLFAHLCTDAACCQAYVSVSKYLEHGNSEKDLQKMKSAVNATSRQVLTYDGKLIEATYFSCSGGKTEDAAAVWGKDVPYLLSVESPGEEKSRNYIKTVSVNRRDFLLKLGLEDDFLLSDDNVPITYTKGNGIAQMRISDHTYTGPELRELLELPSTVIDFRFKTDMVEITTKGNGHRVGMSQYGADAMAHSGKDYKQILSHYYTGTNLITLTDDQLKGIFDKA